MARIAKAFWANIVRNSPDLANLDLIDHTIRSERDLQVAVFAECERRARTDSRYDLIFAIPNGGHRHRAVAAKLKGEGVKAGVPDIFIAVPSDGYHGFFIELKYGKNRPSAAQQAWLDALAGMGYRVAVIHDSVADVMDQIEEYLKGAPPP